MFNLSREKGGSMYLTLKRLSEKPPKKEVLIVKKGKANSIKQVKSSKVTQQLPTASQESSTETRCLIRVQNGKRKISTIVQAKDLDDFRTVNIFPFKIGIGISFFSLIVISFSTVGVRQFVARQFPRSEET